MLRLVACAALLAACSGRQDAPADSGGAGPGRHDAATGPESNAPLELPPRADAATVTADAATVEPVPGSLQAELEYETAPPASSVPATASPLDFVRTISVAGRNATLAVYGPRTTLGPKGTAIYVAPQRASAVGQTAIDYLASTISQALCNGYRAIQIPQQTLVFDGFTPRVHIMAAAGASACELERVAIINDQTSAYHVTLSNLQDVSIDFQASTLYFTNPLVRGMSIASPGAATTRFVRRARLSRFGVKWSGTTGVDYTSQIPGADLPMASPVTITAHDASTIYLDVGISSAALADATKAGLRLRNIMGYFDFTRGVWDAHTLTRDFEASFPFSTTDATMQVSLAPRVTLSRSGTGAATTCKALPQDATTATTIPCNTFSTLFNAAAAAPFTALLRHHGTGHTIVVSGLKTEDVELDHVTLWSGAYMGFTASHKRGFAVTHSTIAREPGALLSTASDAFHVVGTSDVLASGNSFVGHGDDGFNIQSNRGAVASSDATTGAITIPCMLAANESPTTGLVNDSILTYLGTVTLAGPGACKSGMQTVTASAPANGLTSLDLASRVIGIREHHPRRIVIENNSDGDHRGRGVLAQASLMEVVGNTFDASTSPAVLVTSDNFEFHEGLGATSVLVAENTVTGANYLAPSPVTGAGAKVNAYPALVTIAALALDSTGAPMYTPARVLLNVVLRNNTFGSAAATSSGANFGPKLFVASATGVSTSGNTYVGNVAVDPCSTMSAALGATPLADVMAYGLSPGDLAYGDALAVESLPAPAGALCP